MPSASLQSRIKAFEALVDQRPPPSSYTTTSAHVFSLKPPQAKYPQPSANILESPISPTSDSFQPIAPLTPPQRPLKRSPSPSPPNLGRKTSLIDLKDWIVDDGPTECPSAIPPHVLIGNGNHLKGIRELSKTPPPLANKPASTRSPLVPSAPLINFEPPPTKSRPPLPPRRPSTDSSISSRSFSDSSAALRLPGQSDSLTVEHTYPPPLPHAFSPVYVRHAPASSISSFHSVSLSSDGSELKPPSLKRSSPRTTGDNSVDGDVMSIADSFENVSVSSAISPTTTFPFDWEKAMNKAGGKPRPELPKRPAIKPPLPPSISRSASSSSTSTIPARRPAPPPPASHQSLSRTKLPSSRTSLASTSNSDHSSILSDATTTSRTSISTRNSEKLKHKASLLLRPTPVPPAARARYETLFVAAVISRRKAEKANKKTALKSPPSSPARKSRQAAGWRGISVDLITNPEDHPVLSSKADVDEDDNVEQTPVGPEERLSGRIVRFVWSTSKLDRQKLRDIWNDCNPSATCSLDREAFVKGMWRIDEELRRAQLSRRMSALSVASSQRIPYRPKSASNSKLILQ